MISALVVLHNFIVIHDPGEISKHEIELDTEPDEDNTQFDQATISHDERTRATTHRDCMALAMWEDYNVRRGCR